MRALFIAAGLAGLVATPALAQDAKGMWLHQNGVSKVRISDCGGSLCGTLASVEPGSPAKVGMRIFYNMKPNGPGKWSGNAFNPEDGKTYSGTMAVSGGSLTTAGCALGGLICRSVTWSKTN